MKKTLLCILSFAFLGYVHAQFGYFASAAYIHANDTSQFYSSFDQQPDPNAISSINFQGANLGTYVQNSDSLYIGGGEVKTFKNTNGNVCSVDMYYTVYPVGNRPGNAVFQLITLGFYDNCSGSSFPTGGPCNPGDQKWQSINQNADLTTLSPGTYTIEIYYQVNGTNDNNCGDAIQYDNNNSNLTNYSATFTISSVTPVVLQSFTATHYSDAVLLKWVDDQEINNKGFEVERSTDGEIFTAIDWQNSKGNDGNTSNIYTYSDNSLPNVPEVFYRLKIIGQDGNYKYSFVIPVDLSSLTAPLTSQLNGNDLSIHTTGLQTGTYKVELYSIDGKLFNSANLNVSSAGNNAVQNISMAVNNLPNGVYAIIVRDEAGRIAAKTTFIK